MPLNAKGNKIMGNMEKEYGPEKAKRVFYASINAGKIKGVEPKKKAKGGGTREDPTFPGPFSEDYDDLYEPSDEPTSVRLKRMEQKNRDYWAKKKAKADVGKAHGGRARKRADR